MINFKNGGFEYNLFVFLIKHSLISIEQLSKYFDQNQLTSDLDGTMAYNHEQWIEFRIVNLIFFKKEQGRVLY